MHSVSLAQHAGHLSLRGGFRSLEKHVFQEMRTPVTLVRFIAAS
jgi:hypothetical protein